MEKNIAGQKPRLNILSQAGQGILEYILVLVVVVIIALGLIYQFNSAFGQFLDSYFGEYLACLIESGELPSLGGGAGVNSNDCDGQFQPFDINNGRPLLEFGEDQNRDDSRGRRGGGRRRRFRLGGGVSNGEGGRRDSRGAPGGLIANPEANRPGQARSGNRTGTAGEGAFISAPRRRRNVIVLRLKDGMVVGRKAFKRLPVEKGKLSKSRRDFAGLRPKKLRLDPKTLIPEKPPEIDDTFSFSQLIKWLVILAIIVAIVIFIGGQALQIKKAWEKPE